MVKPKSQLIENPADIQITKRRNLSDMLGHPPSSILTFGPTLILILLVLLMSLAWFIQYPDIIPAKVTILTENPAIRVFSRQSGKIDLLLVTHNEMVEEGQPLALLDNTADWKDMQRFEAFVATLKQDSGQDKVSAKDAPQELSLGSLQKSYATLLQKLKDYNFFNRQTEAAARIASLENQKSYISKLNTEIEKQEGTLEQEVEIALGNYQRDQQLQKEGLLAEVALKKSETEYLQYQRQLENLRTQYINNNIRIEELQSQIIGIRELRSSGLSIRQLTLEEDLDRIQGDIDDWKLQYLITAPIAGSVSLADIWSPQQFVRANEEIMAIVPRSGSGKVIGKAILPIANSGKVRIGQDANILLDGFPFQEFGVIPSKVKSISLIPQKDNYLVAIELPDSLRTTYDVEIPFRQEMSGTVNIITENRRILERVLDRLLSIVKNS